MILRSDIGPQFSSNGFRKFADEYGFRHVTSSPHYPRSNRFIESQLKLVKKSLAKAKKSGLDLALALLCLRATPIDGKSKSPAELLFGRQLQDNLPRRRARNAGEADHFAHLAAKQEQQNTYYDQHARRTPLSPVVPSQPVVIRNESTNKWEPVIVKSTNQHQSAIVETSQGKTLCRNRIDIRPVSPKQVRFEVSASEPQPTQHQSPEEDVSKKASQAAATPSSTPEVSSAAQTRSGRTVKAPDKLNLWDDCFFLVYQIQQSVCSLLCCYPYLHSVFLLLYEGDVVICIIVLNL